MGIECPEEASSSNPVSAAALANRGGVRAQAALAVEAYYAMPVTKSSPSPWTISA
jgi:hypothetical protein